MTDFSEMVARARQCSAAQTPEEIHLYETAMTLAIRWTTNRARKMPRHLYDATVCEDVIWDTFTLALERFERYYKANKGKNVCSFLWDWCIGQCLDKALAMHLPGRFYGATCHTHSKAAVCSIEDWRAMMSTEGRSPSVMWQERDTARYVVDIERIDATDAVRAAMKVLTDDQRDIIEQRYFKHRKLREIAATRRKRIGPDAGKLGVSFQYIENIERGALAEMRRFLSKEATCGAAD